MKIYHNSRCRKSRKALEILRTENTPAFTTATACKRALTGVGATIAAGSQR